MGPAMSVKAINDILAFFERTSDQFFSKDELRAKLRDGKKLRIKYGVDVTAPTLHIGHAVNLWLMRHLQDRGHKVVFLILSLIHISINSRALFSISSRGITGRVSDLPDGSPMRVV